MGCVGCNDGCFDESVQLAQGPTGNAGANGSNGSNGLYGGWSLKWKFDNNTGSGTGSNEVRLNNVDPQAANVIYVNDDAYGTGAADVFLSSVTSAPFGKIKIFKEYDSTVFWLATITAADDTAVPAEVKFTVTDVVTNGSFTDGDDVVLTLAPAGATGSQGPIGVDGVPVLFMDTTGSNTASNNVTSSGWNPVRTDTIAGGTIGTIGDFIKIKGEVISDIVDNYTANIRVRFGGADMFQWFVGSLSGSGVKFEIDLVVSDTDEITPHIQIENYKAGSRTGQFIGNFLGKLSSVAATYTTTFSPGLSSDKDIIVEIESDNVNTSTLSYYEVTKYLKS